jgi:hypothetical protein
MLQPFTGRPKTLILRSGVFAASRRMKASDEASWFETAQGRLLTMRDASSGFGRLMLLSITLQTLTPNASTLHLTP